MTWVFRIQLGVEAERRNGPPGKTRTTEGKHEVNKIKREDSRLRDLCTIR